MAVAIALLGGAVIWLFVPYNNFVLRNTYLSDSFLPEIVVGMLCLMVLGINPLLRLLGSSWTLDRQQLALAASLMLLAAVIPSNGLMRMFPRIVAESNQGFHSNQTTARIAAEADFRPWLFPDPLPRKAEDGSVQTFATPISDQFLDELDEGASLPWSAWVTPMAAWGALIFALWAMMLGLAGVVFPQWRNQERLAFPLLNVYQAITGDTEDQSQRVLPAIFYNRAFWIAAFCVFFLHALRGLNIFTGAFPSFPLSWNLEEYFSDSIFRQTTVALNRQSIFFAVVGVAYFIPNRYAISIWGWVVAYSIYITLGRSYIPAFQEGQVGDQSFGVMLAIAGWVLWLGRSHWAKVGRAMLGRCAGGPESRRDAAAGWMFVLGFVGIVAWLVWAGCALWWSLLAAAGCAIVTLLMARIVAETGIPVYWINRLTVDGLAGFLPLAWQSPAILYFTGVCYALLSRTTAVSAAVMATLALGMDRRATPAAQTRLLAGGWAYMIVGFVLCGAMHLNLAYHNADISTQAKSNHSALDRFERSSRAEFEFFTPARGQQAVGVGIGAALLWACSRFPAWPIHPVGIYFSHHSIGHLLWFSVFLGWLIKSSITGLFGGGAYRQARPVFLGLIIGEVLAVLVWALVPVIIILITGAEPHMVPRYILTHYP